jgi:hypothetical protein
VGAPRKQRVISTSSAYNATDVLVGGLPDGYFVTADIDSDSHVLYLRNVADMGAALDSVSCAYKFFPGDGLTQYGVLTARGDVFYMRDTRFTADPTSFYRVSQSGGALVVDEIGPVDIEPSSAPSYLLASNDGAQLVIVSTLTCAGYNATTGVQQYEVDLATALGTSNIQIIGIPKPNRIIIWQKDADQTWLLDETGATLDTNPDIQVDARLYECAGGPDLGILVTRAYTNTEITYNYVEIDESDVVTWRWERNKIITTPHWTGWTGSNLATRLGSYGDTCAITMRDRTGTYDPRSIWLIDLATGDYVATDVSPYAANGAYAINPCGANATVLWGLDLGTWSGWAYTPPPDPRRPFGSGMHLRQRQTPFL